MMKAFGDSIVKGEAVSYPFPSILATKLSESVTNSGINGAQIADCAAGIYGASISDSDKIILSAGVSDMRTSSGTALKLAWFNNIYLACLAFLAVPDIDSCNDLADIKAWLKANLALESWKEGNGTKTINDIDTDIRVERRKLK